MIYHRYRLLPPMVESNRHQRHWLFLPSEAHSRRHDPSPICYLTHSDVVQLPHVDGENNSARNREWERTRGTASSSFTNPTHSCACVQLLQDIHLSNHSSGSHTIRKLQPTPRALTIRPPSST